MANKSPAEIMEALGKPFPRNAIKKRQGGGGKMYDYVETHAVVHRLNAATGGEWSFVIRNYEWRGDLLIVHGELTIPGLGTRSAFGVQQVKGNAGEDLVKGGASDALKKAATLFGVALDLYGEDYESAPVEPQKARSATKAPAPVSDDLARQKANKRAHAVMDHALLHDAAVAKFKVASVNDLTADQLTYLADLEEGKADKDAITGWERWKMQRAAAQAELMPGENIVPNPHFA